MESEEALQRHATYYKRTRNKERIKQLYTTDKFLFADTMHKALLHIANKSIFDPTDFSTIAILLRSPLFEDYAFKSIQKPIEFINQKANKSKAADYESSINVFLTEFSNESKINLHDIKNKVLAILKMQFSISNEHDSLSLTDPVVSISTSYKADTELIHPSTFGVYKSIQDEIFSKIASQEVVTYEFTPNDNNLKLEGFVIHDLIAAGIHLHNHLMSETIKYGIKPTPYIKNAFLLDKTITVTR